MIWDLANFNGTPSQIFSDHKAAVKALSWCPWQSNLLASGGGTADKTMKFWDTKNGKLIHNIDTESQVCSILWSRQEKELITSSGYSKF